VWVLFLAHIPFAVNRVCDTAPTKQPQHSVSDEQQDKFIDLQDYSTAKDLSDNKTFEEFWIHVLVSQTQGPHQSIEHKGTKVL